MAIIIWYEMPDIFPIVYPTAIPNNLNSGTRISHEPNDNRKMKPPISIMPAIALKNVFIRLFIYAILVVFVFLIF